MHLIPGHILPETNARDEPLDDRIEDALRRAYTL
jgi:hypothetical protein